MSLIVRPEGQNNMSQTETCCELLCWATDGDLQWYLWRTLTFTQWSRKKNAVNNRRLHCRWTIPLKSTLSCRSTSLLLKVTVVSPLKVLAENYSSFLNSHNIHNTGITLNQQRGSSHGAPSRRSWETQGPRQKWNMWQIWLVNQTTISPLNAV